MAIPSELEVAAGEEQRRPRNDMVNWEIATGKEQERPRNDMRNDTAQ